MPIKPDCIVKISFHRFLLKIPNLLNERTVKINRDFVPSNHSRLCSIHLEDDCFIINKCSKRKSNGTIMNEKTTKGLFFWDIRKAINEKKTVETKISNVDLVTETDKRVEEFLKNGFLCKFPDHCFIGEESTSNKLTDAPTWIIDPVDGTMNFVHSYSYTCISIGLAVNKKIVLGVIYNPVLDQMYTGVKGRGSFCNGKKLKVSNVENLSEALVIAECGSDRSTENMEQLFTNFRRVVEKAHGLRMMGSAALNMCTVASGGADTYFEYSLHCWDMAAGKVIVEEAGGVVIDPEGGEFDLMSRRIICASSLALANTLSKLLKHTQFPRDE